MKKLVKQYIAIGAVLLFFILSVQTTRAAEIYFEFSAYRNASRAVEYERRLQMTTQGLREAHILRIPLDDPYIEVAPVASQLGLGRRQTTQTLLANAGAVAGVNADFFNMTTTYALLTGTAIQDGELMVANAHNNRYNRSMGTFFVGWDNFAFFDYMRVEINLYHFNARSIQINYINNVGNTLTEPAIFTRSAMETTAPLIARFPGAGFVVSDGAYVTYVTPLMHADSIVDIPEEGFVIVFPANIANSRFRFWEGEPLRLSVTNSLAMDFADIQSAIGGAGMLLINGQTANDGGFVPTGRHPRTAVGVSVDGTTLILMVVDGRGVSVGATHTEMATLMRQAGAWNAMHFDGGGSSTMVVAENNRHNVVNIPSEGSQRTIVNALGIFDNIIPGPMVGIAMETNLTRTAVGVPITATVYAVDAAGLRFPLHEDMDYAFMAGQGMQGGLWWDNQYVPSVPGEHILSVFAWDRNIWAQTINEMGMAEFLFAHSQYGDILAPQTIYVMDMAELRAVPVAVQHGGRAAPRFSGIAVDGSFFPHVNVTDLTVSPTSLGYIEDGYFVATGSGTGYIRARLGSVVVYVPVSVGALSNALDMRWSLPAFSGYPADVTGSATLVPLAGQLVSRLHYNLNETSETQAAHLVFDPPLAVPSNANGAPTHLRMQVYGDGSGHWLRGRVTDADGISHVINFAQNVDFVGWNVVTAALPANLPLPLTLDRVWMASLSSDAARAHSVYFYNIQALFAPPPAPVVPAGTRFVDPMMSSNALVGVNGGFNLSRSAPMNAGEYRFDVTGNTAVARLSANGNGLDERSQWDWLTNDIAAYNPTHLIIRMNVNPQAFPRQMFELFHAMMRGFVDDGRTVLVFFPGGEEAVLTLRDGVRYIATERFSVSTQGGNLWWYGQ